MTPSGRGSAIAGIACGLPVVAHPGPETASPITDAGVVLIPQNNPAPLHAALTQILSDAPFNAALRQRSQVAYHSHFSWSAIAARYAKL